MATTSSAKQYRWPAEWEHHSATWLAWPRKESTWPGIFAEAKDAFTRLVHAFAGFEQVQLLCGGKHVFDEAEQRVGGIDGVTLVDIDCDDSWIRDYGPQFVIGPDELSAIVDWRYNAWGGKYPPWDQDDGATERIAQHLDLPRLASPWVLEGGSIEGDGQGTILTTERCLLDPNRNPGATRAEMELALQKWLGAERVLWMQHGQLAGDDTDGHIDQLARFLDDSTILAAVARDSLDENFRPLQDALVELKSFRKRDGTAYDIVPVAIPRAVMRDGERLPASYCNFSFVNNGVILPAFGVPEDDDALRLFQRLFPHREIRPVACQQLVWGLARFIACRNHSRPHMRKQQRRVFDERFSPA